MLEIRKINWKGVIDNDDYNQENESDQCREQRSENLMIWKIEWIESQFSLLNSQF